MTNPRTHILVATLVFLMACLEDVKAQDSSQPAAPVMTKNPTTAVLLSLPLPGLGQFYNEEYWKIPVFTGTCGISVYLFFSNNTDFNNTVALYDKAVEAGADETVLLRLRNQREAFRSNRDIAGIVFFSAYLLAAMDAYVGAHLYDFNVSEDLSLGFGPTNRHFAALNLRYQW